MVFGDRVGGVVFSNVGVWVFSDVRGVVFSGVGGFRGVVFSGVGGFRGVVFSAVGGVRGVVCESKGGTCCEPDVLFFGQFKGYWRVFLRQWCRGLVCASSNMETS